MGRLCFILAALWEQAAWGQVGVSIVQPGAPGNDSKAVASVPGPVVPAEVDVRFMQGMIMHHAQAVEMTDLLRKHGRDKALQAFGKRIAISQGDEIRSMKRWLEDHGQPVEMKHDHAHMELMPGMLSEEQMRTLAKATGRTFDRLFLTGMIQHHNGALVMVDELFNTPGASQDPVLFDFANDIDNTQRAEINIMRQMLGSPKESK